MYRNLFCLIAIAVVCFASEVDADSAVDFDSEIVPVLTRYGCNAGACHGAAVGRGGFKLSLFGSRPDDDYVSIVREIGGRRVNLVDVGESLLLRKATETIEHGGGERFGEDSTAYRRLARWITEGAKRGRRRQLRTLRIEPSSAITPEVNRPIAFSASATFDDGDKLDVTDWTVFTASDDEAVAIDAESRTLRVLRPGEHVIVARFLDRVRPFRVAVPFGSPNQTSSVAGAFDQPGDSYIDRLIDAKLKRLGIPASPESGDEAFARRVWLDLTGRLPKPAEVIDFVEDADPDKRSRLIDRLLADDDFAVYWALKWAGVLAIDSDRLQVQGARAYHEWIAQRLRQGAAWNESASLMLSSSGDGYVSGPVNFLRSASGPRELAELATRVFMGVRLRCANCHDHPLDRWTQDDYHGLAAAFAKLERGRVVKEKSRGEVTHPVSGEPAIPRLPGERFLPPDADARTEFAAWVTSADNPYFAHAAVNRIWAQLMGRGLVDPVDDIRSTNPASHPELLDRLAAEFVASGFRFKPIVRAICNSRAYGRSSRPVPGNEHDQRYYSHALVRPLEAEVIAQAIASATGVDLRFADSGGNQSIPSDPMWVSDALRLTDNRVDSVALDLLGRCDRSTACEPSSSSRSAGSLAAVLHLLSGDLLNRRLADPSGTLHRVLEASRDDRRVLRSLYMTTLSRRPDERESTYWNDQIERARTDGGWASESSRREFFADLFWALLSSETFATNH